MSRTALFAASAALLLFVSFAPAAIAAGDSGASESTDHSAMDHSSMDHSAMGHEAMDQTVEAGAEAATEAATETATGAMQEGMDHAGMESTEMDHSSMDHSAMGEGSTEGETPAMEHDHEAMMAEAEEAAKQGEKEVGIEENLGGTLADAVFTDSDGNQVNLRELCDVPTILIPIYFKCPDVCNLLQSNFAQVLPEVKLTPGKEIQVVSLSFDARDDTKIAARAKAQYVTAMQGGYPAKDWHFLTGDQKAIDKALDSIGYTVRKQGGLFAHPVAVVVVAPGGKIVRYLYGPGFLPFDITMAATEAASGKIGLSVKRLLSLCYNYDPEGRRYVFSTLRVAGFSIVAFIAVFVGYLVFGGKKRNKRG